MLFHNMSPSSTTGNPSAVCTQYFTENAGLQLPMKVSAFPSSSHSDSGEGCFSRLNYSSLALRPVALLALLSELTRFASSHRGRLLPGFRRFGHPLRRRISLQCQLGNLHWRDFHPQDHRLASLHHRDTTIPLLGVQKLPMQPEITTRISLAALPVRVVIDGVLGAPVPPSAHSQASQLCH